MDSTEESGTEIFCDPCQVDSEYVAAVCYCGECKEYLCKICRQVHQRLAATRQHVVKENNDLPKPFPSERAMIDLPEKCLVHTDRLIDRYCLLHKEVCCAVCLSKTHNKCEPVKSIHEYLQTVDMAQELTDLKCKMQGLVGDVKDTLYLVQNCLKAIELNHEEARSKMLELKTSVAAHIEEIYGNLGDELNEIMKKDIHKIQPYKMKCDAIKFDLNAVESFLRGNIKNNKLQLFLSVKKAEVKVCSNQVDLQEIRHKCDLNVTRYSFSPDTQMVKLKTNPDSFGTYKIQDGAIKSARLDKTLHAGETDNEESCCVTGLAVLSKSTLVIADHNNKAVKLVDVDEGLILSKVTFESAPWDVTAVSDKQIAVTVPDNETVNILSVTENRTLQNLPDKQIIVNQKCYGVTCANEKLFITTREPPKIVVYNADGEKVSSVDLDMVIPEYIIVYPAKSKLYVSDNEENGYIKEFAINDLKETNTYTSCRDEVLGMAVDKTGVLYYCESYYHAINTVCIETRQGCDNEYKTLIPNFSHYPKCVAFDDETNRLFVGMDGNEIAVYYVV